MAVKNIILKDADGNYAIPYVGIPSQAGNEGKVLGTNGENLEFVEKQEAIDSAQLNYYGTCDTAAATRDKIVVCPTFTELKEGISIRIKFAEAQTYNGAVRLNVNGTGIKDVKYIGTTNAGRYHWQAGEIVAFTYNGTNYVIEDGGLATTTYYGYTRLADSAISTSTVLALTARSLNYAIQFMIEPYPIYSASGTYNVGDRVRNGWYVYECIVDIPTAEAWTAAHWEKLDPIQTQIDGKQDTITDLSTIRSGAEKGATAVQPNDNISELNNDAGYITSADLPTNHVTTDTAQDVSGDKTFKGITAFQNGSANGCVILGANAEGTNVSNNYRKLGRMSFHTYENTVDCAFVSTDSQSGTSVKNYVEFGGRLEDKTNTSPDVLRFTIAKVHNTTTNANKVYGLEMSYSGGANFGVQPKYNNVNLATETYVTSQGYITSSALTPYVLSADLATVATSGSYNDLSDKPTIPTVNDASLIIQKNGTNVATFTANASSNVTANISVPNTVSSVSSSSTNADAVGAKLFYDTVGDIETALHTINSGGVTMNSLTFNLTGVYTSYLSSLTVNGTTYTYSDFTNNSLTLSFPQGTSITWSATTTATASASPSSGSLTLSADSTIIIEITVSGGIIH